MTQYIIAVCIIAASVLLCSVIKPLKAVRSVLLKVFSGFALLVATSCLGVGVGVNLLTAVISVILGVPGTIGVIAVSMIL